MRSQTPRFGLVASRFNREITQLLLQGALSALKKRHCPVRRIDLLWVPGAFELPVAALRMARSRRYQAVVAVGCIIEGETPHWKYLSQATLQGLALASVLSGVPVTCGVVTARRWEEARARAKEKGLNRGRDAAEAAWNLVRALKGL